MSLSSTSSSDRAPGKATRALAWCVVLLLAVELTLFVREATRGIPPGIPEGALIHINLGTSRTLRGVQATSVQRELRRLGEPDAWVANVTESGRSMTGLAQLYEEQIAPRIHPRHRLGILAIEVRGVSMNDMRLASRETRFALLIWASQGGRGLRGTLESWFHRLRITDLQRAIEAEQPGLPEWARSAQGWKAFPPSQPVRDLASTRSTQRWLLRGFTLGGRQTNALRYLIRRAREDGWTPVLYTLPITPAQRSFFEAGDYQAFLAHGMRIAGEQDVPWIDLDTGHILQDRHFRDPNHVNTLGARLLSRCFARAVLHDPSSFQGSGPESLRSCLLGK